MLNRGFGSGGRSACRRDFGGGAIKCADAAPWRTRTTNTHDHNSAIFAKLGGQNRHDIYV